MTEETKTISEDDRLKALALAVTANDLYRQACKLDMTMQRTLGANAEYFGDGPGRIGDLIYDGVNPLSAAEFDEALKDAGYVVQQNKKS